MLRVLVIACVAAMSLAACGSSAKTADGTPDPSSSSTVTADPRSAPTKAEYLENADALCRSFESRINTASDAIPETGDPEQIKKQERIYLFPLQREELASLQALTPPVADAAMLNAMWKQADEAMLADEQDFDAVNAELTAYGFQDCAF